MAIEKFRFVSPGVQINEIDDSIITPAPPAAGPVVIGTTAKGPAMQPVLVNSVAELEKVFGGASNGNVGGADVWRTAVPTAPTLATYAAKAFLRNSSPVTVVRLAGVDPVGSQTDDAGWTTSKAFGLFAVSGSDATLGAVIYTNTNTSVEVLNNATWSTDQSSSVSNGTFQIRLSSSTSQTSYTVSLTDGSTSFIRNVLNTNPTLYNQAEYGYFLGETFEKSLPTPFTGAFVARLDGAFADYSIGAQSAETGYIIGDHPDNTLTGVRQLFKFVGLNAGASTSRDIKISIENVRPSRNTNVTKYGSFDVVIRKLFEPTNAEAVLERFNAVNLDPTSDNYIAKRIGDSWREWDLTNNRYNEYGTYTNKSVYVRVVMGAEIKPEDLPHGFVLASQPTITTNAAGLFASASLTPVYPKIKYLTTEISASAAKTKRFGLVSHINDNADLIDIIRYKAVTGSGQVGFTTRFVNTGSNPSSSVYVNGAYNSTDFLTSGRILGFDVPVVGGFDGADLTMAQPFVNDYELSFQDENNGAEFRAIKAAIDIVADPETIDMNVLCVPGLQNETLTSHMIDVCKTRGDSLALVDLKGDYLYAYETGNGKESRPLNTTDAITNLTGRSIDSSYGAAYFPAVFVPAEGIFMPASIAALGAFGGTEGRSALWFAPAGFNRGGLTEGTSGIGVSRTALQLNSSDRDALYQVNINPIATFPGEGVLIFGQKTLQVTPSALDRVNVRRLLNFVKKQISRAATRVLFEPNVEATWNNFKAVVEPFLQNIRNGFGLDDAKVILDETTTTADLVDRNIMYCKILIKPTRAIEYIGIDFVVTNSGAAFSE